MDPFPNVPLVAKVCPKCITGNMSFGVPVDPQPMTTQQQSTWCCVTQCPKCDYRWYVCQVCTNTRSILNTELKLKNHSAKYHSQGIAWNANQLLSSEQKIRKSNKATSSKRDRTDNFEMARNNLLQQRLHLVNNDVTFPTSGDNNPEDNTPSRVYGGIPTVVKECKFSRVESTEYFGNKFQFSYTPMLRHLPQPLDA